MAGACSFHSHYSLPKLDFWGIRLPHGKKSKGGQALSRGITQGFRAGFLWDTSKVQDADFDVTRGSFDFKNTHLMKGF